MGEEDSHLKGSTTDTVTKVVAIVPQVALAAYTAAYVAQGVIVAGFIAPEVAAMATSAATSASAWAVSTPAGLWLATNPDKVVWAAEVAADILSPDPPSTGPGMAWSFGG